LDRCAVGPFPESEAKEESSGSPIVFADLRQGEDFWVRVGPDQRNSAAKKPPIFLKNLRSGARFSDAVAVAAGFDLSLAGGGSGTAKAGAALRREPRGSARTSSSGAGGGGEPLARNTKGAVTCT